jgi:hypothetical protein
MPTVIKSEIGEQVIQTKPLRTFEVPDASEEQYEPLPATLPRNPNYPNAEPIGGFNARQASMRAPMSFDEVKRAEEAMKAAKQAKFAPTRLSMAAKARIDMLCGISRPVRECEVDGQKYVLKGLKTKENREALLAASAFDGTIESPFEVRKQLLARSLVSAGGADIDMLLGDGSMEARLELIDELPDEVATKLFDEYNKLCEETRAKYFPKTEAEAAEVISDLGK